MTRNEIGGSAITWVGGQADNSTGIINDENIPRRLALTLTCLFFRGSQRRKLLVCNPHPDTWNTWMLPYGAVSADVSAGTFALGMRKDEVEAKATVATSSIKGKRQLREAM